MYREAGIITNSDHTLKDMIDELAKIPLLYQPARRGTTASRSTSRATWSRCFPGQPFDEFLASACSVRWA